MPTKEMPRNPMPLVLGVGIPVALLILVLLFGLVLPQAVIHPSFRVLYTEGTPDYNGAFAVQNGKLTWSCTARAYTDMAACENSVNMFSGIYIYDDATGSTRSIAFADAQKLHLSTSDVSPDGYRLVSPSDRNYYAPFLLGGSTGSGNARFVKGIFSKNMPIQDLGYGNFKFRGWVTSG